jgi:hypothetical protein
MKMMKLFHGSCLSRACVLFLLLFASLPTKAATFVWANIAGGDWNTAANWNPATVPGPGDDAVISASGTYTITVSANTTVGTVTLNAASGAQTLDLIAGAFALSGAFEGNAQAALIFDGGSATNWNGGVNNTVGSMTINGGSIEGSTPMTVLDPGGFIWNASTAGESFAEIETVLYVNGGQVNSPYEDIDGGKLINTGVLNWNPNPFVENGAVISNAASGTINVLSLSSGL